MSTTLQDTEKKFLAEVNVLGSILVDANAMDEVYGDLKDTDFTLGARRLIWQGLSHLYQKDQDLNAVALITLLRQHNRLEEAGGSKFISEVQNSVPTAKNVKYYAELLRSNVLRETLLTKVNDAKKLIETSNPGDDDEGLLAKVEHLILSARPDASKTMKHISEYEQGYFDYLDQDDNEMIQTGFPAIDAWMGGLGRGWLYILAGRPSAGKTAKALQMARSIAECGAGDVLLYSQEMSTNPILSRILSGMTRIPSKAIRKKRLTEERKRKMRQAFQTLNKLPLHIEESKGVSINQVKATAKKIHRKKGKIGAIIVDYLTLMTIDQGANQRWDQAVGRVTREAKLLAMELDCPFIMLAQLNREGADKKPVLTNLRDSGDIEQDADVVEFLWQNPDDPKTNAGEIIESVIAKGRDVGTRDFKLLFKKWFQEFSEIYPGEVPGLKVSESDENSA